MNDEVSQETIDLPAKLAEQGATEVKVVQTPEDRGDGAQEVKQPEAE